jgi:hypothetical protein
MIASSAVLYMKTWLTAATEGNVSVDFAVWTNRMCLYCEACGTQLTVPAPNSLEFAVDFSVQEFAKLHRHDGKYKSAQRELETLREDTKVKREVMRREAKTGRKFR